MGFPLVENCLAGFNSSIFAYGQVNEDYVTLNLGFLLFWSVTLWRGLTVPFVFLDMIPWKDWQRKDIYNVGTSECLVRWWLAEWTAGINSPCLWTSLFTDKRSGLSFSIFAFIWHPDIIMLISVLLFRSKLSILRSSLFINAVALFWRQECQQYC